MNTITIHDVDFTRESEDDFYYPSTEHAFCEVTRSSGYIITDITRLSDGVEFRSAQVDGKEQILTHYEGEVYLNGKFVPVEKRDTLGVRVLTGDMELMMLPEGWVDAAWLHLFLRVKRDFTTWVRFRIEGAELVEGQDFRILPRSGENTQVGRPKDVYWLSLDAAKHCAMLEKNEHGKRIRKYFIESEKRARLMFDDPLVAARLFVEAEERRRATQQNLEVAQAEKEEAVAQAEALVDKLDAPNRDVHLKQFFKETADVLGYSSVTGFKYLVDVGILVQGQGTKWNKVYAPSATYDRKGLFRMASSRYARPTGPVDAAGDREVVYVDTTVVMVTKDVLDGEGNVQKVGGYTWLRKKMLRDPRTTLSRLVAKEGGPDGVWAPLYGCILCPVSSEELLTARGSTAVIRYFKGNDSWIAARFSGKTSQTGSGKTLTEALRALLESTPADSIKPLKKRDKTRDLH